ncbi:Rab geranylgeranyltransferase [Giardia lamblia P15]|uniref:Protein farnesyltransferase/geranylgeranyltransferase type-1 subunit alpha n=1 Tax=Giardia intestinalis (strain P15) TaxID=658858 RepID=E1EWH2_GIAIA|nr:Rab geranylgeranyltransferase [Giardia lamblia P15]
MESKPLDDSPHEEKTDRILLPWVSASEARVLVEDACLALQTSSQTRTLEQYELGHKLITLRPTDYAGYRLILQCVQSGIVDPQHELDRSAVVAQASSKNFQVWPHRYALMQILPKEDRKSYYELQERSLVCSILSMDSKNYHVWNYKMSLASLLDNLDWKEELQWVEQLLEDDLLNNSYWAYRLLCVKNLLNSGELAYKDELSFVDSALSKTPANQAIWDYLRGLYDWFIAEDVGQGDLSQKSTLEELYDLVLRYTTPPVVVPAGLYLRVLLLPLYPEDTDRLKELLDELTTSHPTTRLWTLMTKFAFKLVDNM